ncbi:hypothetical protein [Streptomyces sp. G45]|uniref:hypothetical protein n=1 Tax=Streptomyces sp. G45 TaxID=3406627 RepID=UPI003C183DD2
MSGTAGAASGPTVSAFRQGTWQGSLDSAPLPGGTGRRLALVPEIVAHADRRWWDGVRDGLPPLTGRRELLLSALESFAHGTVTVGGVGPQSAEEFRAALWETAGLPGPLVDRWCRMLREGVEGRAAPAPAPDAALALVSLPGNTFTCLDSVLDQAERSAGVWVRPSRREPLSAARLVAALLGAGWPPARLGLYPTEQRALHGLVKLTDRHVVYGGAGLAASVRGAPTLTLHGPGRGCALVPRDLPVEEAVAWLLPLVAADSGRFCSNVRTAVCADEGLAEPLAKALAAALDALHPGPVPDPAAPDWPLTAFRSPGEAERAAASVRERLGPGDRLLTREPTVVRGAAGEVYVRPHLALLDGVFTGPDVAHPLVGHEVPFPSAVVLAAAPDAARAIADRSLFVHRHDRGTPATQEAAHDDRGP